jgi:exodeoxyribonuclease-3
MKLFSWNVNGLRAALNKGFMDFFTSADGDCYCLQEIKLQAGQVDLDLEGYRQYWNYAEKKGYAGTAIFTKAEPMAANYGLGQEEHDREGRVITLEYEDFFLVNCYTPNSQRGLVRLEYRLEWERDFQNYLQDLDAKKPVVLCGDLNVAHREIDIKNPATNRKTAGFTDQEREKMTELLAKGFVDTFRHFYPDKEEAYTWWSNFYNARERNIGWRIDYFLVSQRLKSALKGAEILPQVLGSDHCPVSIELEI